MIDKFESQIRVGVIEDTIDPLKLGRYRVRVTGVHGASTVDLPTEDLPWAITLQSVTSAAISGIGDTPRLVSGSWVLVIFADVNKQKPIILGSIAGISNSSEESVTTADGTVFTNSTIDELITNTPLDTPKPNNEKYVGSMTSGDISKLINSIPNSLDSDYNFLDGSFIGKYKININLLQDFGFIKSGVVDNFDSDVWLSKEGITNKEIFFSKQDLQDELIISIIKYLYTELANSGILSDKVSPEKTSGVLFSALICGIDSTIDYIKGSDKKDYFDNKTSYYYKLGYLEISGLTTNENPTIENLTNQSIDKKNPFTDARKYDIGIIKSTDKKGFKDPNGKYPLKNHLNESDLNRLARGSNISKTIVGEKESKRITNIPVANGGKWDQSPIPYGTIYPNNKVMATESGHIMEFDDSPGNERINIHHSAGTFTEIDSEGNKVERTKGIRTIIVEDNELVYIKGSGHVTIDGDHSLLVKKALNVQIMGDANIKVHGNMTTEVLGDYNLSVGGNLNIDANNLNLSGKQIAIASLSSFTIGGSGSLNGAFGNLGAPISILPLVNPIVKKVESYSPNIKIPAPISRHEVASMALEDTPEITSLIYKNDKTMTPIKENNNKPINVIQVTGECGFEGLNASTQISTNYKLKDLIGGNPFPYGVGQHSLTAEELACNLKQLSINVVEPLKEKYSHLGFKINSGFREAGSKTSKSRGISQHELGCAIDVGFTKIRGSNNDREQFFNIALEIKDTIPYDQLILEYNNAGWVWLHISYKKGSLRREILTMNNDRVVGRGLILLPQV